MDDSQQRSTYTVLTAPDGMDVRVNIGGREEVVRGTERAEIFSDGSHRRLFQRADGSLVWVSGKAPEGIV